MSKRMKILFVLTLTDTSGGGNKSFMRLLKRIYKDIDARVISPDADGIAAEIAGMGIPVDVVPYEFATRPYLISLRDYLIFLPRYVRKIIKNNIAVGKISKIAQKYKPDLIHTNASVCDVGIRSARRVKIPHVLHIREYGEPDVKLHIYGIERRIKGPYAHSITITEDIARYYDILDSSTNRVIYNPVADESLFGYETPKESYFFYAGRIEAQKGVEELIDAYIEYRRRYNSKTALKLAGLFSARHQQPFKARLDSKIRQAGLSDSVEWLGKIDNVSDYMSKAVATVIPSPYEAFGRVMPEALSNGSLVIGRDTAGTHEQFENGLRITGGEIGIRYRDTKSLADSLYTAETMKPKDRKSIVMRGQTAVRALYTDTASSTAVKEFFNDIISKNYI